MNEVCRIHMYIYPIHIWASVVHTYCLCMVCSNGSVAVIRQQLYSWNITSITTSHCPDTLNGSQYWQYFSQQSDVVRRQASLDYCNYATPSHPPYHRCQGTCAVVVILWLHFSSVINVGIARGCTCL